MVSSAVKPRSPDEEPVLPGQTLTAEPEPAAAAVRENPPTEDPDRTAAPAADPGIGTSLFERNRPDEVASAPSADLPVRDRDRYEFGDEHARGGLGKIMLAHDRDLDRKVAVKELLNQSNTAQARFVREAMITARLEHPAIVPVHEAGRWSSGEPFYAMKMVSGRSLSEVIKETSTLEARLALLPNVIAVADAIAYAHSELVIHRDLKPSNVMVGAYGETVVIDWGLAKDMSRPDEAAELLAGPYRTAAEEGLTTVGAVMGTPAYMPPEQAEGLPVDERADVYSIGAILYHVLTGDPPYRADSSDEVLELVKKAELVPVKNRVAAVPGDLAAIVGKAMAQKPGDRYSSGRELAKDLRRYQSGKLVGAREYRTLELVSRWVKLHRTVAATTLVFLVVALAGATWFVTREQRLRKEAQAAHGREGLARAQADEQALVAIEQQAHAEFKAGRPFRSAVLFNEAYRRGLSSFASRVGLYRAMRYVDRLERTLRDPDGKIGSARYSPDGKSIVTASGGTALIWDAASGSLLRRLVGHEGVVLAAVYSHDGSTIATTSDDDTVRIWEARSGQLVRTFRGHESWVDSAEFSPDGTRIASSSFDGTVQIWDVNEGRVLYSIRGLENTLSSTAYSPDGSRLVTTGRVARIWNATTGELLDTLNGNDAEVRFAAYSPDGRQLVTAEIDGRAHIWDALTGNVLHTLDNHESIVNTARFSSDGEWVVTASYDRTAKIWQARTGKLVGTLSGPEGWFTSAEISPDGSRILTASQDGTARLWHGEEYGFLGGHESGLGITIAQFSPDGRSLLSWDKDAAQLWDVSNSELKWRKEAVPLPWNFVAFSPDSSRVAVGTFDDGHPRILLAESGEVEVELRGHSDTVWGVDFSPDGSHVVTASNDKTMRLWDARTGEQVGAPIAKSGNWLRSVRFSPDGSRIVTGTWRGKIQIWDVASRTLIREFVGHESGVNSVVYSPDGSLILSAGWDELAKVWDADTGELLHELDGHSDKLFWASFSPDGKIIATTGGDERALFWDSKTGEILYELEGPVYSADFRPDGNRIAVAGIHDAYLVGLETRTAEEIDKILAEKVDWEFHDGKLVKRKPAPRD